jgi:molybdate transport system permease protein
LTVDWEAIALTLKLAAIVSAVLMAVGLPLAYWIAFSRWRWKFLIESIVALPLVLPPTVLGFYVLVAIGGRSVVGRTWAAWFDRGLAFSFEGLVIASVFFSLPFAVQPIASAFAQVDRALLEASDVLGASRLRTFGRVIAPLSRNGIITGAILSFAPAGIFRE